MSARTTTAALLGSLCEVITKGSSPNWQGFEYCETGIPFVRKCRLPTGIFYAQGVKANVLFFDRKPAQEKPWTQKLWIYDLRTNLHFTLKRSDLDDFVNCCFGQSGSGVPPLSQDKKQSRDGSATLSRHNRKESERFKSFTYDELTKRDKVNLDIFWLKDDALEESANLPAPHVIAEDITEDLETALENFGAIAEDVKK